MLVEHTPTYVPRNTYAHIWPMTPHRSSNTLLNRLAHAPSYPMSFARLPHCQIDDLFVFLGPDSAELRRACVLVRDRSNGLDLPFEILKWHCVNSALLDEKLRCLEALGRVPLRCSICDVRKKMRQMFRTGYAKVCFIRAASARLMKPVGSSRARPIVSFAKAVPTAEIRPPSLWQY